MVPKVANHRVRVPVRTARIGVIGFVELDTAFGVYEKTPVRDQIFDNDCLIVIQTDHLARNVHGRLREQSVGLKASAAAGNQGKRGAIMKTNRHLTLAIVGVSMLTGCAASPYDFPQPTMIGDQYGYSMIGFVKKNTEEIMKDRISHRAPLVCPHGLNYIGIKFDDTGPHPMGSVRYEALVTCKA
jgi:hypothetical protein